MAEWLLHILKSESRNQVRVQILQDPNTLKVQKNAISLDKTQHANFRGFVLEKGHYPKICMLCFILISSVLFNLPCVWILF